MASADPRAQEVITCDLCTNPVELFCKPCHVKVCQGCVVKHMVSQQSKDHNVVLFRVRESEPLHPECQKHTGMQCELICKTCDVPACSKCVIGPHAGHTFLEFEEQTIAKMRKSIEEDTIELEKTIIPTYEKKESETATEISSRKQKYSNIQSEIDQHGANWHEEIDKIIKRQKADAKVMEKKDLDRLKKNLTELCDMLSLARDILKRNKDILKSNSPSQIRNYVSRNHEFKSVPSKLHWSLPSFISMKLQGEHLYQQFGELRAAIESEIERYKIKSLDTPEVVTITQTPKDRLWEVCYTHVDKIWIAGQEDTMNLIDVKGTILETIKTLSGKKPQGLTITKEGHLVYGDYFKRKINLVENGETKTIITLSSPWVPRSICFTLSGQLLVNMYTVHFTASKIVRYDQNYKQKQEIQYDKEGHPLLKAGKKAGFVAENKNFDICVSNGNSNSVVTLNQDGQLRWRYTGNLTSKVYDTFNPEGIVTDSQCHVLVADINNHCIHVIDKNGQFLRYIKCHLNGPCSLSIDNEDRLFVGESTGSSDNNMIKVIKYMK